MYAPLLLRGQRLDTSGKPRVSLLDLPTSVPTSAKDTVCTAIEANSFLSVRNLAFVLHHNTRDRSNERLRAACARMLKPGGDQRVSRRDASRLNRQNHNAMSKDTVEQRTFDRYACLRCLVVTYLLIGPSAVAIAQRTSRDSSFIC